MSEVTLKLPYPKLSGNHSKGINWKARKVYTKAPASAYNLAVKIKLLEQKAVFKIATKVHVELIVHPPDRRIRDKDNLEKVFFDALTKAGFWVDDKLIGDKFHYDWLEPIKGGGITLTARWEEGWLSKVEWLKEAVK